MDHFAEIFLDVPEAHRNLEPDALVYRRPTPETGELHFWVHEADTGRELYDRTVPNTPDWISQVKADVTEIFVGHRVHLLQPDGNDW